MTRLEAPVSRWSSLGLRFRCARGSGIRFVAERRTSSIAGDGSGNASPSITTIAFIITGAASTSGSTCFTKKCKEPKHQ